MGQIATVEMDQMYRNCGMNLKIPSKSEKDYNFH